MHGDECNQTDETMKAGNAIGTFLLFAAAVGSSVIYAGTEKFDDAMQPILEQYLKIHEALAADKTEGVKRAAEQVAMLSEKVDADTVSGEHKDHYKHVPEKIKKAAQELAQGKDLGAMREAFKTLSKPMAMWATMSKPKGIYVVYCSMQQASWLQKGQAITNPYYGHEMLRCGEIVGGGEDDQGPTPHHIGSH